MFNIVIESLNKFTVKRLTFFNKSHSSNVEMTTVSVQAYRHHMKYFTRYAIITMLISNFHVSVLFIVVIFII